MTANTRGCWIIEHTLTINIGSWFMVIWIVIWHTCFPIRDQRTKSLSRPVKMIRSCESKYYVFDSHFERTSQRFGPLIPYGFVSINNLIWTNWPLMPVSSTKCEFDLKWIFPYISVSRKCFIFHIRFFHFFMKLRRLLKGAVMTNEFLLCCTCVERMSCHTYKKKMI